MLANRVFVIKNCNKTQNFQKTICISIPLKSTQGVFLKDRQKPNIQQGCVSGIKLTRISRQAIIYMSQKFSVCKKKQVSSMGCTVIWKKAEPPKIVGLQKLSRQK